MKMKLSAFAAFAFMLSLLSGCASKPIIPDWVAGDSAQYNSAQYLIGRGQAPTQEEAKDRARADVAKVFQVAVVASSEDMQRSKSDSSGAAPQYEEQASRSISTRTDQIIRGIQIAELWQDPATKSYYALAVLPRLQTAASLRQQISQLDEATANHIEQSRKSSDLFQKIAAASLAVETEREHESLQKSLQIVDPTGRGTESKWNSAKLQSDLDELLKRVRIASQVSPDSTSGLEEVVAGALANAGFMIETGQNPDFMLQARMVLDDLGVQKGWDWQRGVLEVSLSEKATGRVRGTKRWNVKSSAPDTESAIKRALNQADAILKQELRPTIIDMVSNH
jgi:hypothetical protein